MKRRKLKGFVLPTLYLLVTLCIFTGIILLGSTINFKEKDYKYGTSILKDQVESVIAEDEITTAEIISPVDEGKANINIKFYNKDDEEEKQQNSLIYYKNTYLPNTGLLYTSEEDFEIKSVFEGKVTEILEDEFFSKCIIIEHLSNLRTYYYGIDNVEVAVGDEVSSGTILGTARANEIMNNKKSFLLEVYYNNKLLNPEVFIGTKITDYE